MPPTGVSRLPLREIANLRGGYVPSAMEARERARHKKRSAGENPSLEREANGASAWTLGIQPSAIQRDGTIDWREVVHFAPVSGGERYAIREGDVLLPLRSQRLQAVVARDVPDGVIANGPWGQMTVIPALANADYLAWYLNHPRIAARLAGLMTGSSLQFLTLGAVRDFEIELPDASTQRLIGRVATLTARVAQLEAQLGAAREQFTNAFAMAAVHGTASTFLHSDD